MHAQNCLFRAIECSNRAHSDLDKLTEALVFTAAAAWLRSRRARHGALVGRKIAGTSFGTLIGRRRGRLVGGAGTILPCCWCRSGRRRRRRDAAVAVRWLRSSIELRSSSPLMTRLLQGWSERSTDAPFKPTK